MTPPQAKYVWFIFSILLQGMNLIRIFLVFCSFLLNGQGVQGRINISMVCLVILKLAVIFCFLSNLIFKTKIDAVNFINGVMSSMPGSGYWTTAANKYYCNAQIWN